MGLEAALPSISQCATVGSSRGNLQRPERLGVEIQEAQLQGEPAECTLSICNSVGTLQVMQREAV